MTIEVLFDSGATHTLMRKEIAEQLGQLQKLPKPKKFGTGTNSLFQSYYQIPFKIIIESQEIPVKAFVTERLTNELIIGIDYLKKFNTIIQFSPSGVIINVNKKILNE